LLQVIFNFYFYFYLTYWGNQSPYGGHRFSGIFLIWRNKMTNENETLSQDETEQALGNVLPLNQFINQFGENLMEAVSRQNPPVYNGVPNPAWDAVMSNLMRKPFVAQRERVQATCKLLIQGEQAAVINGEMGCGKTMMGIAAAAVLQAEGYRRTLVISPPHLVYKWRREILETIGNAKVWVLNGPDTLRHLIKIRESVVPTVDNPEFYIIGRVRMRMGFDWEPVATVRKVYTKTFACGEDGVLGGVIAKQAYAACPDCGSFIYNEDNERHTLQTFSAQTEKRRCCPNCGSRLWSLKRPGEQKDRNKLVYQAMCKLPTIGPKTAQRLLDGYGSDVLSNMLEDNVFEFINLMDDKGDLIFSDRQAKRMETALGKQEISFGQGGYQASEFIKRYLPDKYFDLLIVDEGHEYKNAGSAQGQAMGVLAAKSRKAILLTGTLMGGYADDLFYLLWRILPNRMLEDGFGYNVNNSLGSAAMSFLRQHGVLKDIFKETNAGNHRTAKGNRISVQTSKAPGFGPKGVARYVLPFTAFLKLKQIGGNVLPAYDEFLLNVEMTLDQQSAYDGLSNNLTQALNQALRCGDKTLLGVVLTVLLAWPDTCFRLEEVRHPRSKELLAFVPPIFKDDDISPKEAELIRLCKENKIQGRKVLVYTVYTGKRDTTTRLKNILETEGFKTAVLRSNVSTESREDWILDQVDRGIDVLICNPELVKTGFDLLDFPTICFMQSGYNVYTVQQASRRSWRIGQKQDVKVYYLSFEKSAQVACLSLMAKKIAVSQSTSGDMPETGLDVLNSDGDSIEVALAKQLLGKEEEILVAQAPALTRPVGGKSAADTPKHQTSNRLSSDELASQLSQFIGTKLWFRHILNRQLLYTDGVQFFAESGGGHGAYWFLDIVATEYWQLLTKQPFISICLTVKGEQANIEVTNGNNKVLKTREIKYTDMQEGDWKFFLTDNVLMLPSEY
jgi:hypothetical protein